MRTVALPAALFLALYTACSNANPFPRNALHAIPSDFTLAPLVTPPPPPHPSDSFDTDSHIIRDSCAPSTALCYTSRNLFPTNPHRYLIVLQDHLEPHEVDSHHAHVHSLHQADVRMRTLKALTEPSAAVADLEGIVHKFSIGKKANKAARKALKGYAGKFSESTIDAIRAMKGVKFVERDSVVWASEVEKGAPWVRWRARFSGGGAGS
jgi:cerevisin